MYIGIDVGGTTIKVAAFTELENPRELTRLEAPISTSFEDDMDQVKNLCEVLWEELDRIEGVGLAVAGKIDEDRTTVTGAGNLTHWIGQPVDEILRRRIAIHCPVVLGNDAEAAALAEALYGHGGEQDFWFVIWGTGVGGCLVRYVDGKPIPLPGEPGHQCVDIQAYQCGCGQYGCLEVFCGGGAIARRYGKPAEQLSTMDWASITARMAEGVRNLVTIQPVELVIFGGGIAAKQQHLLSDIENQLKGELKVVEPPQVRLSTFGESAGTVGALALLSLDNAKS